MATSAYLSPGPPPLSDTQEEGGVMNLVNPAVSSQSYSVPREQVVRISSTFSTWQILLLALQTVVCSRKNLTRSQKQSANLCGVHPTTYGWFEEELEKKYPKIK